MIFKRGFLPQGQPAFSRNARLQAQERLTIQIAYVINKILQLRGVKKPGTVTSVVRGLFRDNPTTRAELEKDI